MHARRSSAALACLAALALAAAPARAQSPAWPQRAVKFVIPFAPGARADIGPLLFADRLSRRWGQTVVVENRPGADGLVAINAFVNANDDHTLLFAATGSFTVHPFQIEKLPYEPRDLNPIARVSNTVMVVAVPKALGVDTLDQMVALARAQPGKLNTALVPGITELIFSGFVKAQGLDMARIPYRDIVQAGTDVAEGRVQVVMSSLALGQPHLQAGKVKLLATPSHEPVAILPGIPTVAAAGYPALTMDGLVGLFGPRDMPAELRERIATDIRAVAAEDPDLKARFAATGQVLSPGTAADFAEAVDAQRAQVATIAQQIGMKPR